jgi:hypothetical protein
MIISSSQLRKYYNITKTVRKVEKKKRPKKTDITERALNNIDEAWRLRNEIKQDIKEIMDMNLLYVESNRSRSFFPEKQLPRIEKRKNLLKDNDKKMGNFKYVTGNVSAQIMRAFLNFNPIIHLNNLKNLLAKADPEIQQDIKALNAIIEKDIKDVLDPHYYRKKYDRLKARKLKENTGNMKQSFSEDSAFNLKESQSEEKFVLRLGKHKPSIKYYKNNLVHHETKNLKKNKEKYVGK